MEELETMEPGTTPENEDINLEGKDFEVNHDEEIENPEEATEEQAEEQAQEEAFLRIKYNKEEKALSKEEAAILAQKGMNYDKVIERLTAYEQNPNLQYLNDLANRSNMTLDQLVGYWKQQEEEQQLNELIQNNIPEEYAREMLESRKFRENMQKKEYEEQAKSKQQEEFNEFFKTFKDVKPEDIPQEVWEKREQGIPLVYAYMEHEFNKLKSEKEILINNQKNRKKAPGLNTTNYGSGDSSAKDLFLEGFNE